MIFLNKCVYGSVPKKSGHFSFAIKRRTPTPLMALLVTNFLSQISDTSHTLYVGLKRHFFGQLDLGPWYLIALLNLGNLSKTT